MNKKENNEVFEQTNVSLKLKLHVFWFAGRMFRRDFNPLTPMSDHQLEYQYNIMDYGYRA